MQTQTVTEMALMRAEFYRGKTRDELAGLMRHWCRQGLDSKEITFWETRSPQFRQIVCDVAGLPRGLSCRAWAHLSEESRLSIRAALRELRTVISDGMDWRRVEVATRQGVA